MLAAIYESLLGLMVEAATALTIDSQLYHSRKSWTDAILGLT